MDNKNTIMFDNGTRSEQRTPKEILLDVYEALDERGYNPIDQIVDYLFGGNGRIGF